MNPNVKRYTKTFRSLQKLKDKHEERSAFVRTINMGEDDPVMKWSITDIYKTNVSYSFRVFDGIGNSIEYYDYKLH